MKVNSILMEESVEGLMSEVQLEKEKYALPSGGETYPLRRPKCG